MIIIPVHQWGVVLGFHSFEALNDCTVNLWSIILSRVYFYIPTDTQQIACQDMQLRNLKLNSMLTNLPLCLKFANKVPVFLFFNPKAAGGSKLPTPLTYSNMSILPHKISDHTANWLFIHMHVRPKMALKTWFCIQSQYKWSFLIRLRQEWLFSLSLADIK